MRFPFVTLPIIALVAIAPMSGAQSVPNPPADSSGVSKKTAVLEPVRVNERSERTGYRAASTWAATRTSTPLRDVPQSVTVVTAGAIRDQAMSGMSDVVRYIPGILMGQGEGNRDAPTIRGNATTADFFVDGVRDDVQYMRDLYNVARVEALKGSNAMIFGRGGGGGVLNRVSKEADWEAVSSFTLQGGSHRQRRSALDYDKGLTRWLAGRLNAMYERSASYRDGVNLERKGLNPTVTFISPAKDLKATFAYEHFADHRTADRGIPSFGTEPLRTDPSTFFGNAALSYVDARVNSGSATITRTSASGLSVRNHTRVAGYDKSYQNVFPGAVSANALQVSISAYNNATRRRNQFNQTDVTRRVSTGPLSHLLLFGAEIGRQTTDNFRETGYFNNTATSVVVPVNKPTTSAPLTFRQSATDADNHVTTSTRSLYAQDQVDVAPAISLIGGVRYEKFDLRVHNNRIDSTLRRADAMVSPRAGILFRPLPLLSVYGSYSVSFLPSAGDQFSSLTVVTKSLEPERFTNRETGLKWDVGEAFSLTAALFRLDRTNTRTQSSTDPGRIVQTGSQRTNGYELGASGGLTPGWEIFGGLAVQNAYISSTTSAAKAGATVPLVPRTTLSLWNRFQVTTRVAVGAGVIHQSRMYAAINNAVFLPSFTRFDGSLKLALGGGIHAQLNTENLFSARYYPTATDNNNITPGSPRTFRFSLQTGY